MARAKTLADLKASGYQPRSVRDELRANLAGKLSRGEPILDGIVGFDETVVPEIENAILSGHHMVFLGERGQAKSRIIRSLVTLLDEEVPVVDGCAINDDPLAPICGECRRRLGELGDGLPVGWLGRDDRYGEKLATPDVSIADLIGEIDPIKVAEGRYLADIETIHYGIIPRCNRGIFAINELPDLTEKVQVGLFNLMEEKDVQIKGYKIRLPVDVVFVASANPEDYTSRGRIITPLKDRFDTQIRTHYPMCVADEIAIMEQELPALDRGGRSVQVADFIKEIVARFTFQARASNEINQASGVSVRMTINNYESLLSNAEKRAIRLREADVVPRISDLHAMAASTNGKIEFEYAGEDTKEGEIIERLLSRAVLEVFDERWNVADLAGLCEYFERGGGIEVSDVTPAQDYLEAIGGIPGLNEAVRKSVPGEHPLFIAAAIELILEGLHLHQKLNKNRQGSRSSYHA